MRKDEECGFTLIELLIVVAIIGILASMLIPNLLDSLEKAKQKRSMVDMRDLGTGMMAWLTDHSQAAAAGQAAAVVDLGDYVAQTPAALHTELVPRYIQAVVERDGWKNPFDYYLNIADPHGSRVMAIRSGGKDGIFSGTIYAAGSFEPTDYRQDLVWIDGFFVRWPQKLTDSP